MKKKISIGLLLLLAAMFLFAACGGGKPAAFTEAKDMGITVGGTWYKIHEDAAPLLEALGSDCELFAAPSCLFEGEDKEFAYANCSVFTNPDGDKDIWYIFQINDNTYKTARDITVGSTKDELTKAYGEKFYMESDYQMVYSVSGVQGDLSSPCIIFDLEDDTVTKIEIYYPTNA